MSQYKKVYIAPVESWADEKVWVTLVAGWADKRVYVINPRALPVYLQPRWLRDLYGL